MGATVSKLAGGKKKRKNEEKKKCEEIPVPVPRASCSNRYGTTAKKAASYVIWIVCSNGFVPDNAFTIDDDDSLGYPAYIGIVTLKRDVLPGMLLPEVGVVGVTPSGSLFTAKKEYKALTGKGFFWRAIDTTKRDVPTFAVQAGKTRSKKKLYVGRTEIEDVKYVGMVHKKELIVRYKEQVLRLTTFDILCCFS
ncbi:Hypothetical predicted protein [Cloeon dipterum]|uniref:Uncharacterized protein n=1 Tax=Cloeon dipterum TaxID=197152 RepID=A0A8S1DKB2_9INSE|nr:Hypothetical predicted protein [Cloeon dipterum]